MKRKTGFAIIALLAGVICFSHLALAAPPGTWTTDFTLFNLGSADTSFTMTRYDLCPGGSCAADPGTVVTTSPSTIAKDGSFYYNPINDSNFPTNFSGSIVVSSEQQLAGTVTLGNGQPGAAYASDAYSAITSPSTSLILPIVMAGLGPWNTRMSIQNTGSTAADVQIQYVGSGAPATSTITGLPQNKTAWVDQFDLNISGFNGSAIITSTNAQPLAIVVEEYKSTGGVLLAYNGLSTTDASTTVYMPGYLVQGTWATDFTVVNTSATAAQVTISFAGSSASLTGTIAANGAQYFNQIAAGVPAGWTGTFPSNSGPGYYGAATVTATGGNVVVVYNIANSAPGGAGNLQMAYLGFPPSKAVKNVVVPLIENEYGGGKWVTTYTVQSVDGTPATLTLTYAPFPGSPAPLCNPCNETTGTATRTFNQKTGPLHVPTQFGGGVSIASDKNIVVIADQTSFTLGGDTAAGFAGFAKN